MEPRARAGSKRGRRCHNPLNTCCSQAAGFGAAYLIAFRAGAQGRLRQFRLVHLNFVEIYDPQTSGNAGEVGFVSDFLVTQKLGPGPGGRIGKVLHGPFALRVPARGTLVRAATHCP